MTNNTKNQTKRCCIQEHTTWQGKQNLSITNLQFLPQTTVVRNKTRFFNSRTDIQATFIKHRKHWRRSNPNPSRQWWGQVSLLSFSSMQRCIRILRRDRWTTFVSFTWGCTSKEAATKVYTRLVFFRKEKLITFNFLSCGKLCETLKWSLNVEVVFYILKVMSLI